MKFPKKNKKIKKESPENKDDAVSSEEKNTVIMADNTEETQKKQKKKFSFKKIKALMGKGGKKSKKNDVGQPKDHNSNDNPNKPQKTKPASNIQCSTTESSDFHIEATSSDEEITAGRDSEHIEATSSDYMDDNAEMTACRDSEYIEATSSDYVDDNEEIIGGRESEHIEATSSDYDGKNQEINCEKPSGHKWANRVDEITKTLDCSKSIDQEPEATIAHSVSRDITTSNESVVEYKQITVNRESEHTEALNSDYVNKKEKIYIDRQSEHIEATDSDCVEENEEITVGREKDHIEVAGSDHEEENEEITVARRSEHIKDIISDYLNKNEEITVDREHMGVNSSIYVDDSNDIIVDRQSRNIKTTNSDNVKVKKDKNEEKHSSYVEVTNTKSRDKKKLTASQDTDNLKVTSTKHKKNNLGQQKDKDSNKIIKAKIRQWSPANAQKTKDSFKDQIDLTEMEHLNVKTNFDHEQENRVITGNRLSGHKKALNSEFMKEITQSISQRQIRLRDSTMEMEKGKTHQNHTEHVEATSVCQKKGVNPQLDIDQIEEPGSNELSKEDGSAVKMPDYVQSIGKISNLKEKVNSLKKGSIKGPEETPGNEVKTENISIKFPKLRETKNSCSEYIKSVRENPTEQKSDPTQTCNCHSPKALDESEEPQPTFRDIKKMFEEKQNQDSKATNSVAKHKFSKQPTGMQKPLP